MLYKVFTGTLADIGEKHFQEEDADVALVGVW
jgi:hypothetical protein